MEKVERIISVFDKKDSNLLKEINIDNIPIAILKNIFQPLDDDPFMINPQIVRKKHIAFLKPYLEESFIFDFKLYLYSVDCFRA